MMKETKMITIAHALKKLKILDSQIEKKASEFASISADLDKYTPTCGSRDAQLEACNRLWQSIQDLIRYKLTLRRKIAIANTTTKVSFEGVEYTLQDILSMKEGGKRTKSGRDLVKSVFIYLKRKQQALQVELAAEKAPKDQMSQIRYYYDVQGFIDEEAKWDRLFNELDYLIEQANFTTQIDIDEPECL
jgi:hypothetical protein